MSVDELVPVRMLRLPLDVHARAVEHQDELRRELALIELDPASAPARLLALGRQLTTRFGAFTAAASEQLVRAHEGGRTTIDVVYEVPRAAGPAAAEFERLLDEVDRYCRSGELLTLATPEEGVAYRRWFLGQFVAQTAGAPATPWPGSARDVVPD